MDRRVFSQTILMGKLASSNTKNNKHLVSIICSLIGEHRGAFQKINIQTHICGRIPPLKCTESQKQKQKTCNHQLLLLIEITVLHGVVVELVLVREVWDVWDICESCESRASTLPFPPLPKRLRS